MMTPLRFSSINNIFVASFRSLWLLLKGEGQYRDQLIQTDPPSNSTAEWHSFLRTWPYPPSEHFSLRITNQIFNAVVNLFRMSYLFVLILGGITGINIYKKNCKNYAAILVMLLIGWSALLAFCLAMGVVDTVALPIFDKNQSSYIRMGFFPMHFLLMISVLAFFGTLPGSTKNLVCTSRSNMDMDM